MQVFPQVFHPHFFLLKTQSLSSWVENNRETIRYIVLQQWQNKNKLSLRKMYLVLIKCSSSGGSYVITFFFHLLSSGFPQFNQGIVFHQYLLHLAALKSILLYFYGAGHYNDAWQGSHYLHNMEKLPQEVLLKFIKEQHIMRHQQSHWNGIFLDIYIKITFMRGRKDPEGNVVFKARSC